MGTIGWEIYHSTQSDKSKASGSTHRSLNSSYQGRDFRLTDVFGDVIKPLLV